MPAEETQTEAAQVQETAADDAKAKRRRRRIRALRSFLLKLVSLLLVVYILVFHIIGITTMPNADMTPRLDAGDLLLFYRVDTKAKVQDIVVIDKVMHPEEAANRAEPGFFRKALNWLGFKDPDAPETQRFVCRVIAVAGDTVDISDERGLSVNGNTQIEPKIFYATRPYEDQIEFPIVLGEGEYFVLADYRNGGADSRYFGPVKQEEIQGIVITILRRNNL